MKRETVVETDTWRTDDMHVVCPRAAGLDVHKMCITAAVRQCAAGGGPAHPASRCAVSRTSAPAAEKLVPDGDASARSGSGTGNERVCSGRVLLQLTRGRMNLPGNGFATVEACPQGSDLLLLPCPGEHSGPGVEVRQRPRIRVQRHQELGQQGRRPGRARDTAVRSTRHQQPDALPALGLAGNPWVESRQLQPLGCRRPVQPQRVAITGQPDARALLQLSEGKRRSPLQAQPPPAG